MWRKRHLQEYNAVVTEIQGTLSALLGHLLDDAEEVAENFGWDKDVEPNMAAVCSTAKVLCRQIQESEGSGYLGQIPKSLSQRLTDRLSNLSLYATEIAQSSNRVDSLATEVELLNEVVWDLGIRYKGKRLLAFDAKMAEIEILRNKLQELLDSASAVTDVIQDVGTTKSEAHKILEVLERIHGESVNQIRELNSTVEDADRHRILLDELSKDAAITSKAIADYEASALANSKSASTTVIALETYYGKVDTYEGKLNKITQDAADLVRDIRNQGKSATNEIKAYATSTVKKNTEDIGALTLALDVQRERIEVLLEGATGASLFHAFEKRQLAIKSGLPKWLWTSLVLIMLSVAYSVWLLGAVRSFDTAFYVKLGFSLTFFAGITFTLTQYRKERRLEEEYAFKAAMSVSLAAYRNLVEQALEKLSTEERGEYATFLTKSIGTIFDPPTDRVFGDKRTRISSDTKIIASIADSIRPITDLVRQQK